MSNAAVTQTVAANDVLSAESRYVAGRDIKDIAKLVRADIVAAVKVGTLPAGLEASVRISRYSMGQSLYVTVTAVPASVLVPNVARVRQDVERPHDFSPIPRHSAEARRIVDVIERLVSAYNRDRSDIQSDHFDVNFYAHVGFAHEIERAQRAEIECAIRGSAVA